MVEPKGTVGSRDILQETFYLNTDRGKILALERREATRKERLRARNRGCALAAAREYTNGR